MLRPVLRHYQDLPTRKSHLLSGREALSNNENTEIRAHPDSGLCCLAAWPEGV